MKRFGDFYILLFGILFALEVGGTNSINLLEFSSILTKLTVTH